MFRSLKITSLAIVLLTGVVLVTSSWAHASPFQRSAVTHTSDGRHYQLVKYGDLDLSTLAGNQTLYSRIRSAAKGVCIDASTQGALRQLNETRCQRNAIAEAVAAIANGRLTAVHNAKALRPAS